MMPLGKTKEGRSWANSKQGYSARQKASLRRISAHPLRLVVDSGEGADPNGVLKDDVDVLECGHVLSAARDMIGRRYPERRRCVFCSPSEKKGPVKSSNG